MFLPTLIKKYRAQLFPATANVPIKRKNTPYVVSIYGGKVYLLCELLVIEQSKGEGLPSV